jgi:hypothetical protein
VVRLRQLIIWGEIPNLICWVLYTYFYVCIYQILYR